MDSDIHKNFIYVLMLFICLSYSVDAIPCPMKVKFGNIVPCLIYRIGNIRIDTRTKKYEWLERYIIGMIPRVTAPEEAALLQRALRGGATGPGTGIGESLHGRSSAADLLDRLQLHININNDNNNQINQSDSGNVAVSQVQAQLSPDQCQPCPTGSCPANQICVHTSECPGIEMSCRSIVG